MKSSKFRIKLDLSNVSVNPSRWWFLIPQNCDTVQQLKQQIVDKFNVLYSTRRIEIEVQDFIVPDDELIDVFREEDTLVLRLKASKLFRFHKNNEHVQKAVVNNVAIEAEIAEEVVEPKKKKRKKSKLNESIEQPDDCVEQTDAVKRVKITKSIEPARETEVEAKISQDTSLPSIDGSEFDFPLPKKHRRRRKRHSAANDESVEETAVVEPTEIIYPPRPFPILFDNCKRSHVRFDDDDGDELPEVPTATTHEINHCTDVIANESSEYDKQKDPDEKTQVNESYDLSKYEKLVGPPRPKDRIIYQILELSENYCPEISAARVGRVISYDSSSGVVDIELEKPIATKSRRGKFELIEKEEEEYYMEEEEEEEEVVTYVFNESHQLSDMIDVKIFTE